MLLATGSSENRDMGVMRSQIGRMKDNNQIATVNSICVKGCMNPRGLKIR